MAISPFLAMTSREIIQNPLLPSKICWMDCQFSPEHDGLCHLPRELPEGALLVLTDQEPIRGHDSRRITDELHSTINQLHCRGVILDFQRPDCAETQALIPILSESLPCTVAVSHHYAKMLDCPVFLPPVPPSVSLRSHISPWGDREIWLEIGLDGEELRLTEKGCTAISLPHFSPPDEGHRDEKLHCQYQIAVGDDVRFTLWRTKKDLMDLMEEAKRLGISYFVGLYQELGHFSG